MSPQVRKVVVVAGARTPFCKAGGQLIRSSAVQLGVAAARDALLRAQIRPDQVDAVMELAGSFHPPVSVLAWENTHNASGGRVSRARCA